MKATLTVNAKNVVLQKFIEDRNWTQTRFAKEIGVNQVIVNRWFLMKDTPSSTHIPKIERLMGMLIEDIFPKILNNKLIKKTIQRPTIEYENIEIEYMSPQELYEPSYNPVCKMERFELTHRVLKIIATLTPREEKILRMRFGINDCEHTLQEIADAFSISQERVRGIEAKCLRKLRHPTRSKILKPFIY